MKKKLSLLLLSSFFILQHTSYTADQTLLTDHKNTKKHSSPCAQQFNSSNCCLDNGLCCIPGPKGKRGPRGKRGHTGATGASSCGVGEIWMNALQMAGCGEGPLFPTDISLSPYQGCTSIPVWDLTDPLIAQHGGWASFNIPADLDNTLPVTVIVHILVPSTDGAPIGSMAALQVQIAYLSNDEIGGLNAPATGFTDTEFSADFAVTPPDTVFSDENVRQIAVPVSLDPALITPGDWAFISVVRTPATTDEYASTIYLSTLSVQYNRICG